MRLELSENAVLTLAAIILGGFLALLSMLLYNSSSLNRNVVLLPLFLANFPVAKFVVRHLGYYSKFYRGISLFYSAQFISWVAIYEGLVMIVGLS
ncbi:MAG: hypothetical protein B6U73_00140 [Desulfurococcales archaeon ex4484_204]|nr:MAG: hypothetical protein B6U73_00140 [Desulfurococcales archaeon ex4484_204]